MFLAATDICERCKGTIYPSDESCSHELNNYHLECAEILELVLDE
jgi:hypothetical protein